MSILCSLVGASFTVAAVAQVLRSKKGIAAVGNAQVDTAQSKFGGASLLLDGSGDYLQVSPAGVGLTNSDNFTIEGWVRLVTVPPSGNNWQMFVAGSAGGGNTTYMAIKNNAGTITSDIVLADGAGNFIEQEKTITSISANIWYHWAITKSGSTLKHYWNGTELTTTYASIGTMTSSYGMPTLAFVGRWSGDSAWMWNGHLDEIRVSSSVRYTANFTPSTTPFVNDANTVLLIHADGTDASTFFEDDNGVRASKGITAIGNAQIDTAQSKFGGSSLLLDGTDDRLEIYPTTTYNDFTVECWIRLANNSGTKNILSFGNESSGRVFFAVYNDRIYWDQYGVTSRHGNTSISANTWYHLAWSRTGSTIKLFVDGVEQTMTTVGGSGTFPSGAVGNTNGIFIGTLSDGAIDFNGHIDEIRVSDSVRYTTGFTAPTQPFVNDANTLLLIHADGTDASTVFRDDNGAVPFSTRTAKTFTVFNQAQIDTAQYKYGSSSYLGDGTGDYLLSSSASDLEFTGDFTVELWVRLASTGAIRVPIGNRFSGTGGGLWWVEIGTDQAAYSAWQNTAGTSYYPVMPGTISANTWTHLAVVRNGSTLTMYKDGVGGTAVTSVTGTFGATTVGIIVGGIAASYNWNGHIDEVRISNVARYTANFTAPTGPFNNDPNTVLLMHMEGTDASTTFTDDTLTYRTQKGVQANGNAQIDTAQSKFGGTSALFDGTGDYLTVGNTVDADMALTGNNWTVEYWARINAHAGAYQSTMGIWSDVGGTGSVWYASTNAYNGTQKMGFSYNYGASSVDVPFGSALSTGVWQHHAFVRNGNTLTAYLDGVSQGTHDMTGRTIDITGFNSSTNTTLPLTIGAMSTAGGAYNGHLDEVRISNTARYTAAFTPSTTPFQNDANTVLLLHCDGTDASTVFFDDNGIAPYTP